MMDRFLTYTVLLAFWRISRLRMGYSNVSAALREGSRLPSMEGWMFTGLYSTRPLLASLSPLSTSSRYLCFPCQQQ